MDILYLHVMGEHAESLRFSLRSIANHGINVDRVFICGQIPDWVSDEVIRLSYNPDPELHKAKNIFKQVLYAVENTDIGVNNNGDFLVSMDDHFYVRDVNFNKYPIFAKDYIKRNYRYVLPDHLDHTKMSVDYQQILVNTYFFCVKHQLNVINFCPHRNMRMNRHLLKEMCEINKEIVAKDTPVVEGLCVALNYRLTNYPFKYLIDVDIKRNNIRQLAQFIKQGIHVFSMNDFGLETPEHQFLKKLYPNPSKYETI